MGIMVYSLLWVMQDFVHQPKDKLLFHNGSFKQKRIRVWYSKAQFRVERT